jgi:hypothetical protein
MESIIIKELFEDITGKVNGVLSTRAQDPFSVQFDYGNYSEVVKNLTDKGRATTTASRKKYPLIWLVMDFPERFSGGNTDYYCELPNLQLLIVMGTSKTESTAKRYEKYFLPRLYPIYEQLKKQMVDSGFFTLLSTEAIPHEKIDRPYWGGQDSGDGKTNLFNDYIDCIQIRNLKLFVNENVPDRFRILSS